ncbi:MAG: AAA family ATPase [Methylobacteriaceae bacterium]|nr:AAA family ATPase [Methylobacteriaceae bacterium]
MPDLDDITTFLRARLGGDAQVIDTHISRVVIGPERAFKIKKPVAFSYLDFSTREKRAAAAETEIAINRRTAPAIYLGTRRISRAKSGGLELDGDGETIETIVEMRPFDQADLFDQMAHRGALTAELMTQLTEKLVAFHRDAPPRLDFGGSEGIARILAIDEAALAGSGLATPQRIAAFEGALREKLAAIAPLLDARRATGKVRRCHGDLTLRNICLFEGEPTPFDAIEFDERLGTIDVLYDLAFLLMDLTHRGLAAHANLVFNRYLDATDETDGLPALPFFMAVRASIRAHVTATQAKGAIGDAAAGLRAEAESYFALAERLIAPREKALVAIGGFSGSGKSTLAAALAPHIGPAPGARILSSDRIRKALHGVAATDPLPPEAYAPAIAERVYARMRDEAARTLSLGGAAIADGVFDRPDLAAAIQQVAQDDTAPFAGLWLVAPREKMAARIEARRGDPSDATPAVLAKQMEKGVAPDGWRRIDAAREPAEILDDALKVAPRT